MLLEVIATSAEDCRVAEAAGADRIELCSGLELGGLTPSAGLLATASAATRLPLMVMMRPRAGGFYYAQGEYTAMCHDAEHALAAGASGLVFGFLHADGTVDAARTAHFVQLAAGRETVFHRAFDVTPDPFMALEQLVDLGVTRVLTTGQSNDALAGAALIGRLVMQAGSRIQVMPGGGITPANVVALVRDTGVTQVHASCSGWATEPSTLARPDLRFGPADGSSDRIRVLDASCVRTIVAEFSHGELAR